MLWLVFFLACALMVGMIAKLVIKVPESQGCLPTILIGVAGFYVGGFIQFLLGRGEFLGRSGMVMGVLGGVVVCWLYNRFEAGCISTNQTKQMAENQKKLPDEIDV